MLIPFILIFIGIFLILKVVFRRKKHEVLKNKYIENHEKKLKDDEDYSEYLEWCKIKGEIALEKEGYDEYRMKEYQLYKKLMKHGIRGFKNY